MREANKAIIRERHIIPKLEDILTELSGATYFTKPDRAKRGTTKNISDDILV